MKEKLINALGTVGGVLYYLITVFIAVLPITVLGLPFWIDLILLGVMMFIPATSGIFWIWGLVATIGGPQDIIAIIYYILFAVMFLPYFINIVLSFFRK